MLLAAASKALSQLLSPEPMLTGRQEVWKASLKLQEKFGKISCNYPNDSCTNHTTAPQIPCLQAEPKPTYGFKETCRGPQSGGGRAKRLQGLYFCWEGGGSSPKALPSSVLFRPGTSYGSSSICLSFFFLAPPSLSLAATPSPRDTEQGLAGEGDSCGLLLSWPGKPPPFWKSKYFLGLRSSLGLSPFFCLSSFLRELSVPLHPGHGHY